MLWVRSCPEELDGQKDTLWLGLGFSPVFLTAPLIWLGWAEVLAGIYVFYYTCYFFHRSNKSVLWETPSGSIRSTEIGLATFAPQDIAVLNTGSECTGANDARCAPYELAFLLN